MSDLEIQVTCVSREMVGGIATVTATIVEPLGSIKRVKDTIIVRVVGGHLMEDDALIDKVREEYANAGTES